MKIWKIILGFFGMVGALFAAGAVKSKEVKELKKVIKENKKEEKKVTTSTNAECIAIQGRSASNNIIKNTTIENVSFTGSAVWGGVLVSSSAAIGEQLNQIIQLSEGGTVVANSLSAGAVHELSVQNVSGSAESTGIVYVLKRNG